MTFNNIPPSNAGALVASGGSAVLASIVRTIVPALVTLIITTATKFHIDLDTGTAETLVNGLVSVAIYAAYYGIVRALEVFKSSKFGWLLGLAKAPVYKEGTSYPTPSPIPNTPNVTQSDQG